MPLQKTFAGGALEASADIIAAAREVGTDIPATTIETANTARARHDIHKTRRVAVIATILL